MTHEHPHLLAMRALREIAQVDATCDNLGYVVRLARRAVKRIHELENDHGA